ncbi:Hypothetical predicted protein, partial [Mytilus galloprovincialis]
MVSLLKEQENFLRNAILTVDHSKEVLQCFLEQHLKNNHQTFEDFLNKNQHDIYHLYYDSKCCQCGPGPLQRKKRILFASQMELLFDKNKQLSIHKTTRRGDFCCCTAKTSVTTAVLDLTLARCLLLHCCVGMFWYSVLDFKGVTLEQFLNSNKHILYHLWKNNTKCCKCQPDCIFPCNDPLIMESEWKKMFSSTLPPCENDRKRPVNGAISICAFSASPSITVKQIHLELQGIIIQYCCSTRKSVEKLAELRNLTFGHVKKASMSCTEFNTFMSEAEDAIYDLASVCGKEDYYRQMLLDLRDKPLDTRMFCQYEKVLLQTISNYE